LRLATYTLFFISVVSVIIAMHISCTQGPDAAKVSTPASQPASQPAAVSVKIDNFTFQPSELEVAVGTTVTWQNADDVPHTATSKDDPQTFDSGALDTDEKFSFAFKTPGKYAYYCKVHPHMTGVVVVK
jgi:plastocyanin